MTALNDADLQAFMNVNQVAGEIIHLDVPTPTVETAADAVGAAPDQIVKSVLFLIRDNPVLAVACGLDRIDRRVIAARFDVGRKRVKLADAETVLAITGYLAGSVPPFGHPQPILTLVDPCIQRYPKVYAGGGTLSALVRLDPAEIVRVTQGEWVALRENA